jgi:DNA-directed RNA polymerase subunit K/omega
MAASARGRARTGSGPSAAADAAHRAASLSAAQAVVHPLVQDASDAEHMGNRFLLSVIAFQRSKQLQRGATARVERNGHKPTYVAVLEVLANRVSWSRD